MNGRVFYVVLHNRNTDTIIKHNESTDSYPLTFYGPFEAFVSMLDNCTLVPISLEDAVYYGWIT